MPWGNSLPPWPPPGLLPKPLTDSPPAPPGLALPAPPSHYRSSSPSSAVTHRQNEWNVPAAETKTRAGVRQAAWTGGLTPHSGEPDLLDRTQPSGPGALTPPGAWSPASPEEGQQAQHGGPQPVCSETGPASAVAHSHAGQGRSPSTSEAWDFPPSTPALPKTPAVRSSGTALRLAREWVHVLMPGDSEPGPQHPVRGLQSSLVQMQSLALSSGCTGKGRGHSRA